jgi:hypothetical protein
VTFFVIRGLLSFSNDNNSLFCKNLFHHPNPRIILVIPNNTLHGGTDYHVLIFPIFHWYTCWYRQLGMVHIWYSFVTNSSTLFLGKVQSKFPVTITKVLLLLLLLLFLFLLVVIITIMVVLLLPMLLLLIIILVIQFDASESMICCWIGFESNHMNIIYYIWLMSIYFKRLWEEIYFYCYGCIS